MTNEDYEKIEQEVIKFLDSIDLISEMKNGRERLGSFMERLEEKYPFKYLYVESLFDAFNVYDFDRYLYERYKNGECYTSEVSYVDIIKR